MIYYVCVFGHVIGYAWNGPLIDFFFVFGLKKIIKINENKPREKSNENKIIKGAIR